MPPSSQPPTTCRATPRFQPASTGTGYVNVVRKRCRRVVATLPRSRPRLKRSVGTVPFSAAKPEPFEPVALVVCLAQVHHDWNMSPREKRRLTSVVRALYQELVLGSRVYTMFQLG